VSARTLAALAVTLACDVAASQSAGIQRAAWLQGCWEMSTPGRSVEEIWTTPKGGSMIGVSRTIRDGTLAEYEMILLREAGDRLAFEAHPSGQPAATFLSTRVTASELVFEDPAHDFRSRLATGSTARRCWPG
jgi:hypothetical protein